MATKFERFIAVLNKLSPVYQTVGHSHTVCPNHILDAVRIWINQLQCEYIMNEQMAQLLQHIRSLFESMTYFKLFTLISSNEEPYLIELFYYGLIDQNFTLNLWDFF